MSKADISGTHIPGDELEKSSTRGKAVARTEATMDEPSAAWGWSGAFPRATRLAGWLVVVSLFLNALVGNHRGNIEIIWLVSIAVGMIGVLVWDIRRRRTAWRR